MLSLIEIFGIAIALAADAFCTALSIGTAGRHPGQTFRLSFHFGLFQFMMPILGWWLGSQVAEIARSWDHWLAAGILLIIGIHMLWEAFHKTEGMTTKDRSRSWSLVALSIATSIDALAVGVVFGVTGTPILLACIIIGIVAAGATFAGIRLGRKLQQKFGFWVEILGAALLILLAVRVFQI